MPVNRSTDVVWFIAAVVAALAIGSTAIVLSYEHSFGRLWLFAIFIDTVAVVAALATMLWFRMKDER